MALPTRPTRLAATSKTIPELVRSCPDAARAGTAAAAARLRLTPPRARRSGPRWNTGRRSPAGRNPGRSRRYGRSPAIPAPPSGLGAHVPSAAITGSAGGPGFSLDCAPRDLGSQFPDRRSNFVSRCGAAHAASQPVPFPVGSPQSPLDSRGPRRPARDQGARGRATLAPDRRGSPHAPGNAARNPAPTATLSIALRGPTEGSTGPVRPGRRYARQRLHGGPLGLRAIPGAAPGAADPWLAQ